MNSRERVLEALALRQPDQVPFIEAGIDFPIRRALVGKDSFLLEELNEITGLDTLRVDFLPPIFGEYQDKGDIHFLARPLIRSRRDLGIMIFPDPDDPALYAEAQKVIQRNKGKYAVGAHMRLGVSPTLLSMGLEGFAYALTDDPGLVDTVLGRYADSTISVVRHIKSPFLITSTITQEASP